MLSKLHIENYALIEESEIDFSNGFTVITGETGSGKSIMLDALSLIMGSRADAKAIADKTKKTIVEAHFKNPTNVLADIFKDNGIDWDPGEIIIRREISPTGKNRSFLNDTPVNLSILSAIARTLIDIHSQHENYVLNDSGRQLEILDSFIGDTNLKEDYKRIFLKYIALRNKIKSLKEKREQNRENKEFLLFKLEQLEKIKPKRGELDQLEKELELLSNADKIVTNLNEALDEIEGEKDSIIHKLNRISSALSSLDLNLFSTAKDEKISERINTLKIEMRDIGDSLSGYLEHIEINPERLEKVSSRINVIYETIKRFKVKDESELVNLYKKLKEEYEKIGSENGDLSQLEIEIKELAKELKLKADNLSAIRINGAKQFSSEIIKRGIPLGLPNLKFEIDVTKGKMSAEGQDIITFKCSFNKSHPMQPVSAIASGGEISRLMLAIKSLMADRSSLQTVIFDEIDTGVSGEIAHKMGKMMNDMSENIQVISVTHLPQVAANAHYHIKVYKTDEKEKTISHIKILDQNERVYEIAGMLSGMRINDAAIKNAEALLHL